MKSNPLDSLLKRKLPALYDELSSDERRLVRNQYTELQEGKCMYCGAMLSHPPTREVLNKPINKRLFPGGFFSFPIHLQHCHKTGYTEGAVHARCNAVLWQYENR